MSFFKDFPGRWGEVTRMDLSTPPASATTTVVNESRTSSISNDNTNGLPNRLESLNRSLQETDKRHNMLGEWRATAIAGNDISASCLYTAGICAQKGKSY